VKHIIIRLIVNIFALLVVVNILSGAAVTGWGALIASAVVIAVLNAVLKPLLLVLTLPINVLTLGLFTLVINAFLMYLTAFMIKGFYMKNFLTAFLAAVIFSIVSIVLNIFIDAGSSDQKK